ncbi:MAG: oxygen-independent coproporphyrinogen III oxidase [Proteobacteria bacterium]|nr:oxygen-independent coproporphyrinogen III oxidase [Pseudomonadota bacterium]
MQEMSNEVLLERLATLATNGPRYTSYPPATAFQPVADDAVRRELSTIGESSAPISLYVHVPFCRSLCAYCACNVIPTRDRSRGDAYVDDLITELAMLTAAIGRPPPVVEIALGGGSPNFLEPAAMRRLIAAIRAYTVPQKNMRMSVELDPRTTTSHQLDTLALLGFKSLSVGVQDFAEQVQDAIRRHQTAKQTQWLIDTARAAGFTDVNIDIVYGLPCQSEHSFGETLDAVVALGPDRIALFGYAHIPDKMPHQRLVEAKGRIPDAYERAALFVFATERLERAGYVHLGLDHFARPDSALAAAADSARMVRTFQGYVEKTSDVVLGLGTSAISSSPRMLWQNHAKLEPWREAIIARKIPVVRGATLDRDDQIRRAVIDRLMCNGSVALGSLCRKFGVDAGTYFARELARMPEFAELAKLDEPTHTITTTPLGRLLVRNICMAFDRYAQSGTHSPTI